MTDTALYNLTWGEYGTSLVSAVQHLRCHGDLVDVTLAAGGRTFHAHKVVLCAASPFLLDLLKSTTCKHPVVMLAGIQASDLEALLEFVYRGEVNVEQNQLSSLLQAAHCLNIQGLAPFSQEFMQHTHPEDKSVLEIKPPEQSPLQSNEQQQCLEEDSLAKKRKKCKRPLKTEPGGSFAKWSKVYVQVEGSDNILAGSQEQVQAWSPQMNIVNVSSPTSVEALPIQTPILVQSIPIPNSLLSNPTPPSGPKTRGASDQPGTCPLCGSMLRQARNLRRHLLTSCKYRMINGSQQNTSTITTTSQMDSMRSPPETQQLHQLQTISVQNLERVGHSSVDHLDRKETLTPISCAEMVPTSSIIPPNNI